MKKFLALILSLSIVFSTASYFTTAANTTTESGDLVIDLSLISGSKVMTDYGYIKPVLDFFAKGTSYNLGKIDLTKYQNVCIVYGAARNDTFNGEYLAISSGAVQDAGGTENTAASVYSKATLNKVSMGVYATHPNTIYAPIDTSAYTAGSDVYISNFIGNTGIIVESITFLAGAIPCEHTGGTATCSSKAVCTKCNTPYGEYAPHEISAENITINNSGAFCNACQTIVDSSVKYDEATATLTVTGEGELAAKASNTEYIWYAVADMVQHIVIDSRITAIPAHAFKNMYYLEDVSFGTGSALKSIGEMAFYNNASLKSFTVGASVETIGMGALSACSSMTSITVQSGNSAYKSVDGILYDKAMTTLITYPGAKLASVRTENLKYDDGTDITDDEGNVLTRDINYFNVPAGIVNIGEYAFSACMSLDEVNVPASVSLFGEHAFETATISNIKIAANSALTYVGANAFNSSSLNYINLPDSVETIGEGAFQYSGIYEFKLPANTLAIEAFTFSGASSLYSVTLHNDLIAIRERAFEDCYALTSMTVPASVLEIGEHVFSGINGEYGITLNVYQGSAIYTYAGNNAVAVNLIGLSFESNGVFIQLATGAVAEETAFTATVTHGGVGTGTEFEQFVLSFKNTTGNAVTPTGTMKIRLPLDPAFDGVPTVYTVAADGTKTPLSITILKEYVEFETTSLRTYLIEYEAVTPGDVNGDAKINSKDIIAIKLHLSNTMSARIPDAMDFNLDGTVDSADIKDLSEYIASILPDQDTSDNDTTLPIE